MIRNLINLANQMRVVITVPVRNLDFFFGLFSFWLAHDLSKFDIKQSVYDLASRLIIEWHHASRLAF